MELREWAAITSSSEQKGFILPTAKLFMLAFKRHLLA